MGIKPEPLRPVTGILLCTAGFQWWMGRTLFGPEGRPELWEGDIWSAHCSLRTADAYSFSHIGHGLLFFAFPWLVARKMPLRIRSLLSVLIEAGWEALENSPIVINRYREATMALGYCGDSILNSMSDIGMMSLGFLLAWRIPPMGECLSLSSEAKPQTRRGVI